ncbi:MAG: type II toxin-antitoxin system prevent-host-death family antitoxin [Deinococcota bacterium]|jgi:prevent-host-death family protein|nr:type II toxin-antitoxin system prevent-host-death family antitoxin [Deinococcota bacterium]
MIEVTAAKARKDFTELLDRAEAGETITVTRHGKVVARIVPADTRPWGDMEAFRKRLTVSGKPASQMVIEERREAR